MSKDRWKEFNDKLRGSADWLKLAETVGLELRGEPDASGWAPCVSIDGGDDTTPSVFFSVNSGYYKDFRYGEAAMSPYDFLYVTGIVDNWIEARKYVAKLFGVKFPGRSKTDPDDGVTWVQWNRVLLTQFIRNKPGVTIEGLEAASARLCLRYGEPCIALPMVSLKYGNDIIGWMFMSRDGLPFVDSKGNQKKSICKTYSDERGFISSPHIVHEIQTTANRQCYWVEGGPDLLAALSRFPNDLFVTNGNGCQENLTDSHVSALLTGNHTWHFIADADNPGIDGAGKRLRQVPGDAQNVHVVHPPYPVEEKQGKDYRDYLNDNPDLTKPLDGLVRVEDLSIDKVMEEKERVDRQERQEAHKKEIVEAHHTLRKVGCMITSVEANGAVELHSTLTKADKTVPAISMLQYDDMIQFLGFDFRWYVFQRLEDLMGVDRPGAMLFRDFKSTLALASTDLKLQDTVKAGAGIWAVEDDDRERTGDLLVVQDGAAFIYNGETLTDSKPRVGKHTVKYGNGIRWFDPGTLAAYLQASKDVKYREETYRRLHSVLAQWNWSNDSMSDICCGLIFASWIQSMLKWRPVVTVTGQSNSGKTTLMTFVADTYIGLANFSAQSTAAGVMQSLKSNSQPLLIDEFDSGRHQKQLLDRFRVASRGQTSLYGTAQQDGREYRLHHIAWIGGIHAASQSEADLNRMLPLILRSADKNAQLLELPTPSEINDLGHRILAGVLVTANQAIDFCDRLRLMKTGGEELQSRYRESYAVPYGCFAAFLGLEPDDVNDALSEYLTNVVALEASMMDVATDQEQMLMDILAAEVRLPYDGGNHPDSASVAELLFDKRLVKYRDVARTKGVGYIQERVTGRRKVAFAARKLSERGGLLRGTEWEDAGAGVHQILARLPEELRPTREKQTVAGQVVACVSLDWQSLRSWCDGHNALSTTSGAPD